MSAVRVSIRIPLIPRRHWVSSESDMTGHDRIPRTATGVYEVSEVSKVCEKHQMAVGSVQGGKEYVGKRSRNR